MSQWSKWLYCLAIFAAVHPVWAQVGGAISGRVEDSTGAGVGDAKVTVKSLETGASRTVQTSAEGNFRLFALPLGQQEVRVEKPSFKPVVRTGINLVVGQEAVVNVSLDLGPVTQEVDVKGEAPVVNTTTAAVSGLVGEREVKDLPLNGRSFDSLLTLNPGAINYGLKSPQTSTSNGNTFSVAGRRPLDNLILLNGIEYTGSSQLAVTPGGVSGELLGVDAVREFNVLTDTYGAEYGKRAGAQVSVVTQSGGNDVHGTVFEFLRNSKLDARNFFDQASVPPFRRNQFGGALGGPIKKDKLFLFGNYEGFRQALAISSVSIVPDALARQGLLPNGKPVANLNANMLAYMAFWPMANGPALPAAAGQPGAALSYNNPSQHVREDFGTMRGDYVHSDRDTLSTSYTIDDGSNLLPMADPLFGSNVTLRSQVASLQETHIFSPAVLNTFTAGFSRAAFAYDSFPATTFPANLSFVTGANPGGITIGGGVTTTGGGSITAAGANNASNVWNRRNLFTYTDNLQITKGIHQISAGVWFQRMQDNEDSASRQLGQASFSSLTTFLQGTVSSFQVVPSATELGWRSLFGAFWLEDSIKLTPRLNVRLGLRDEFTTGWNEVAGRAANYVTDTNGVLVTTPTLGSSAFTTNNATRLLSPRIGLAWDASGNGKTAIRAGFGTYYTMIDALSFLLNSLPPYNGSISLSGPLTSITPISPSATIAPSCGPGVPTPCTTYAPQGVQANAKTPTVESWNFTLEQQLSHETVLRLAYLGSVSHHNLLSIDPNTVAAQICGSASGCTAGGTTTGGAKASVASQSKVALGSLYIPVATRPNPYLGAGFFWFTEGNSSYNALQADVSKRLSRGLQFRANFTWAKNLDMNSGLTGAQSNNQAQMILNRNNPYLDWGPSALNPKYQASISVHYELPFHAGPGVVRHALGGWQADGIATVLSGFPFTPLVGSNRSGDGDTRNPDRPSVNPAFSGPVILGTATQWFNPSAFILPAFGTYGNLGRGVYTGPGLADVDLSLLKDTRITERTRLQFRAEFFNVLNRTNLSSPNTTVFSNGAISSSAGVITSTANTSRQIQFGLKLVF
jgi:hypothetical protein